MATPFFHLDDVGWAMQTLAKILSLLLNAARTEQRLGRGYIAARTPTTQQSVQTPDRKHKSATLWLNGSGYTEPDRPGVLSPNKL
jgi:hypothetical protein